MFHDVVCINFIIFEMNSQILLSHIFTGHSRTIIGTEQLRDGSITMLILDPSHCPAQMSQFKNTSSASSAMRLIRRSTAAMKARQYQIVAIIEPMTSESQYQVNHMICAVV